MNNILTGDLILTSSNTFLHILTAKSSSKLYSHVGIAIRYDNNNQITMSKNGTLYILHMNILMRKDHFNGEYRYYRHTLFSKLLNKGNIVAYRPLKSKYRTEELKKLTINFYKKYKNATFHYESLFLGSFELKTNDNIIKHKFSCVVITLQYYLLLYEIECINYIKFSNETSTLKHMLGCNIHKSLISPGLLSSNYLPTTNIFDNDIIVYNNINTTRKYLLIILFIGYFISQYIF